MAKKGQVFKKYSPEFKLSVILDMREHHLGYVETSNKYGINSHSRILNWERKYLEEGYEGLMKDNRGRPSLTEKKRGRPPKLDTLPKDISGYSYTINQMQGVKDVIVPEGFTKIDGYAFYGCSSLTSIEIPNTMTSIGDRAFYGCSSLTSIVIPNIVTTIGSEAFYGTAYYNDADNWTDGTLYIGNALISVDNSVKFMTVKDGTTSIDDNAFEGCYSLTHLSGFGGDHEELFYAKCTETGVVGGKYCTRCNDGKTTAETVIPALGHDEQDYSAQAPTCTAIGWNAYVTCSRCDYTTYSELKALGHNSDGSIAHKDAKCTETGVVGGKYCTRCNDGKTAAEVVIPALGHDEQDHSAQAPTCTAIGWEAYDTCSRCDYTTYSEISALEHDPIHHDGQAADCENNGWEAYDTCSRCEYTTYFEIPALGHDYVSVDVTEPTCTTDGLISKKQCVNCGQEVDVEEVIPSHGHDWSDWAVVKEASSTEKGLKERVCSRCEFKETVDIPVVKKEDSSGGGCAGCGSSNMAELFSTALLSLAALFFKRH